MRRGRVGAVTEGNPWPRVRVVPREPVPHMSEIVPTTARPELLGHALDGVLLTHAVSRARPRAGGPRQTLEDAGSGETSRAGGGELRVRVYAHNSDPFNFARVNNEAVRDRPSARYVLFLNDDIRGDRGRLAGDAGGSGAGRAGRRGGRAARLSRPSDPARGCRASRMGPSHSYVGRPIGSRRRTSDGCGRRTTSAPRPARAFSFSKAAFEEIGGFDSGGIQRHRPCLRLRERRHRIVLAPLAQLVHAESASFVSHFAGRVEEWNAELARSTSAGGP